LINEGCFSATDNFAACIDDLHPNVIFVGQGTNGGTGAPRKLITLKHSKAEIYFCIMRVRSPKGRMIEGRGTKPDIEVRLSREDVLKGSDPVLDIAIKNAEENISVYK